MAEKKTTKKKTGSGSASSKSSSRAKRATADKVEAGAPPAQVRGKLTGILLLIVAVILLISYINADGAFVAFFANIFKGLFGWGYWLCAPALFFTGLVLLFHGEKPCGVRVTTTLLLPLLFPALVQFLQPKGADAVSLRSYTFSALVRMLYDGGKAFESGGVLGGLLSGGLNSAFGPVGAVPMLLVAFVICAILCVRGSLRGLFSGLKESMENRRSAIQAAREEKEEEKAAAVRNETARTPEKRTARAASRPSYSVDLPLGEEDEEPLSLKGPSVSFVPEMPVVDKEAAAKRAKVRRKTGEEKQVKIETFVMPPDDPTSDEEVLERYRRKAAVPETPITKPVTLTAAIADPPKPKKLGAQELEKQTKAIEKEIEKTAEAPEYEYPPVGLLRGSIGGTVDARDEIRMNRERLEGALHSFGINAVIAGVTHGPTVTRYDIELEQGVKLSRVTNLAGDLALALGVINVRIAPIPDKISTVGIEVPNKIVSTVYLRDIIESPRFQNAKSKLSFALGKDISGECIVGNIAKLPHMLIAGTTGSGKSVCMNSLILSLLYKARPDEVKLIMIDPKMVELGVYNGIPHLYVPVVTEPKKAAGALQWAVVEMLKRYRLFSEIGVRDLESYNRHAQANEEATLPQVVIVIDELADLMLVASKEVEESICRVAQMGRAAGMHLVIATQRPSADVITGLMKANIPSRIAFAVSSAMESRIILDQGGAEKLVGMGDMLFAPVGSGKPTRIQGAFVSDEEREEVIQFIKDSSGEVKANPEILEAMEKATEEKGSGDSAKGVKEEGNSLSGYDEMLPQAVEVVLETGSCSVSMLQRRVKLGYSRAARIVDQMEELGVVGPYEGAKPRAVVIDRAGWQALQAQLGFSDGGDLSLAAQMSDSAYEPEE
jgi:S-DNA-T family DNA segregation ATPase FtsK/SpoIIIE